ncbi:MAG TPA: sulfatase [bacterium]|nr:sulfatase [bacterium]
MTLRRWLLLALLLAAAAAIYWSAVNRQPAAHQSAPVVLIVVDTLRADHVGCYGCTRPTTPALDAFAQTATRYVNAQSAAPWTSPSIAALLTAHYPSVTRLAQLPVVLDESFVTLAELLHARGYRTMGAVSHSFLHSTLGFSQGFDAYDEGQVNAVISSPQVNEAAYAHLERVPAGRQFFLFLHYFDPHYDWVVHPEHDFMPGYRGPLHSGQNIEELLARSRDLTATDLEYLRAAYDSEIRFTDRHIGLVLDRLRAMDLFDRSLIIITADHGEEFAERLDRWIGHTKKLYDEQIHVPLLVKLPGQRAARTVAEPVATIDLMPALAAYFGFAPPAGARWSGTALDLAGTPAGDRALFAETRRTADLQSLRRRQWKLIHNVTAGTDELYDLANDPGERDNVASTRLAELAAARQALAAISAQNDRRQRDFPVQAERPEFSAEMRQRLKALGYLQ